MYGRILLCLFFLACSSLHFLTSKGSSASTSPEIQEFSGIFGIFKDIKKKNREKKKKSGISSIIYN